MKFGSLYAKAVADSATLICPTLAAGRPYQEVKTERCQPVKNPKIGNSGIYAREVYQQGMEDVVDCVSMELDGCWFKYKRSKQIIEVRTINRALRFESLKLN